MVGTTIPAVGCAGKSKKGVVRMFHRGRVACDAFELWKLVPFEDLKDGDDVMMVDADRDRIISAERFFVAGRFINGQEIIIAGHQNINLDDHMWETLQLRARYLLNEKGR